jgi:hypothetical protein
VPLSSLLSAYKLTSLKKTGADLHGKKFLVLSNLRKDIRHKYSWPVGFKPKELPGLQGIPAYTFVALERQNADENGVFLSKAALDELEKEKGMKNSIELPAPGRRLLELETSAPEYSVNLKPVEILSFLVWLEPQSTASRGAIPISLTPEERESRKQKYNQQQEGKNCYEAIANMAPELRNSREGL